MRQLYLFGVLLLLASCGQRSGRTASAGADSVAGRPRAVAIDARPDSSRGTTPAVDPGVRSIEPLPNGENDEFVAVELLPTYNPEELARNVVYPEIAKKNGLEGRVILRVLVGKDGSITSIKVDRSDNKLFDMPATEAVRKTRFTPGTQSGTPVAVWTTVVVDFRLK
jgi:TonB family protein